MKLNDLHYYLLSLFVRGLGFWLLYKSAVRIDDFAAEVFKWFQNEGNYYEGPPKGDMIVAGLVALVQVAVSVYFVVGAPPLLKLANQDETKLK